MYHAHIICPKYLFDIEQYMYVEVEINDDISATSNFFKFKKFKIQDCQRMQSVNNLVTH
jgi:hypothetical protein